MNTIIIHDSQKMLIAGDDIIGLRFKGTLEKHIIFCKLFAMTIIHESPPVPFLRLYG